MQKILWSESRGRTMKLVTDDGLEIPIDQIKTIEATENTRVIVNVKQELSNEQLLIISKQFEDLFKPGRACLIPSGIIEIQEE